MALDHLHRLDADLNRLLADLAKRPDEVEAPGRRTQVEVLLDELRAGGKPRLAGRRTLVDALPKPPAEWDGAPDPSLLAALDLLAAGGGAGLSGSERAAFEPLLGANLAGVRVHEGAKASAAAAAIGASAWAYGDDIVLGAGASRDEVLAHELAHVVAQRGSSRGRPHAVGAEDDAAERDADRAVARMSWGMHARVRTDGAAAIRRLPPGREGAPLVITAGSFADAAQQMSAILTEIHMDRPARLIVIGERSLQVFDRAGGASLGSFIFRVPVQASSGVHVAGAGTATLFPLIRHGENYIVGRTASGGRMDVRSDLEHADQFRALTRGHTEIYIVPVGAPPAADARPPAAAPADPLVAFTPTDHGNAPAWPGGVLPLTPQITGTNTTGSFLMRIENNQGTTTLERVGNLMQPINFHWQVLRLDDHLRPITGAGSTPRAPTRWEAVRERFARRSRDLAADRRTMEGDHPERQGVVERVVRRTIADQVADARTTLAMVGESVMTAIHVVTDRPEHPFSEDVLDIPFPSPGNYFVRCLATPVSRPGDAVRRATTVGGVTVSVYDMATFAGDALGTDADDAARARQLTSDIDERLAAPVDEHDTSPAAVNRRARERAFLGFQREHQQAILAAHGDHHLVLVAERAYAHARAEWLASEAGHTTDADAQHANDQELAGLRAEETRLGGVVDRDGSALPGDVTHTGTMRALLVDEATGTQTELVFAIGERTYINTDRLQVTIADITEGTGRTFDGMGDGRTGAGRPGALAAALGDLRANLHRGRGSLAYRLPAAYQSLTTDVPNPMQLQLSMMDQLSETVDDAAHAATLAAILAAPITEGASLEILAVLAPVQAASAAYRIANRAAYGDLHVDSAAVSDFINIASAGLAGAAGEAGQFASRGVRIMAGARYVAVALLDAGNYVVMSYDFFRAMTAEDPPGADPREGRRRRLQALLSALEGVGIPAASHAFGPHPTEHPPATGEHPPVPGEHPATPTEEHPATPPTARDAASPEAAALGDHAALRRGLPGDLASALPIAVDTSPHFGGTTVHVEYTSTDGLVTDIRLRVGPRATAVHIAEHVATVRAMQRYQGFGGRVRRVLERITAFFSAHPDVPVGSIAWEARFEVQKLPAIIDARVAELANPATTPARRAELLHEIPDLEAQLDYHQQRVDAFAADPGRGFVAARGLSAGAQEASNRGYPALPDRTLVAADGTSLADYYWRLHGGELQCVCRGETGNVPLRWEPGVNGAAGRFVVDLRPARAPERFDAGTSRADAYRELGGTDPTAPFGRYTRMIVAERIAENPAAIQEMMQDPSGRSYDTVRSNLKERFADRITELLVDPIRLAATPMYAQIRRGGGTHAEALAAASHTEMLRLTRDLYESDRGAIAARWYERATGTPTAPREISVTPEQATALGVSGIAETIRADRMVGGELQELKNVQGSLDRGDRASIDAYLLLVNQRIDVGGGVTRRVDRVKVVLLDPQGVMANGNYFFQRLDAARPGAQYLTIEIHSATGRVMEITTANRDILGQPARLAAFARGVGS